MLIYRRHVLLLLFLVNIFGSCILKSMDGNDESDVFVEDSRSEENDPEQKALARKKYIPTLESENAKPVVFQILFENNRLLEYLSHNDALALRETYNKYCYEQVNRYHAEIMKEFVNTYVSGSNPKKLIIKHKKKQIIIDPDSVQFDASANKAYGYSEDINDNNIYKFLYPTRTLMRAGPADDSWSHLKITRTDAGTYRTQLSSIFQAEDDEHSGYEVNLPAVSFAHTIKLHGMLCYRNLQDIDISHNELTSIDLNLFDPCPQLKHLNISHNKISACKTDGARLPCLNSFIAHHNNITDNELPFKLSDINAFLKAIDLSHNKLTAIQPPHNPLNRKDHYFVSFLNTLSFAHNAIQHIEIDTLLALCAMKSEGTTFDISHNPINSIAKPTEEISYKPRIICEKLNPTIKKVLVEYAVKTRKSFSNDLFIFPCTSTLFGTLPPLIYFLQYGIPHAPTAFAASSLIFGFFAASMLCTACSTRLLFVCRTSDKRIFHDYYYIQSPHSDDESDDDYPLAEVVSE